MVDRFLIEVGELPCAEDVLFGQKAMLYGLGMMASAAIGPGTGVAGLAIAPTVPASLSFTIGQGSIYEPETVDATAYSVLGTDSNTIIKQGILAAPATLTVTPPSTSGFSQVYLVQVGYSDVDNGATLVPFYNSLDPTHPSSSTQNTIRQGVLVVQLKAGTAAATGAQTTPTPDPGFTAIWAITVANGATTVTSANWLQLSNGKYGAPWFPNLESLFSLFAQLPIANTIYVNNSTGSDSSGTGLTPQTAVASLAKANSIVGGFFFNGAAVTIQLANTGINYAAPPTIITPPSGGTLIFQGDPLAQSSYVIAGAGIASTGLMSFSGSGNVKIIGLTLQNTGTIASSLCVQNGANVQLQNVSFPTTVAGGFALIFSSLSGSITIGTGCIASGSAGELILCNGGTVTLTSTMAIASTPTYSNASIVCTSCGVFEFASNTGVGFTGATPTGARYFATLAGVINTQGLGGNTHLPGTINGSVSSPGCIDVP